MNQYVPLTRERPDLGLFGAASVRDRAPGLAAVAVAMRSLRW